MDSQSRDSNDHRDKRRRVHVAVVKQLLQDPSSTLYNDLFGSPVQAAAEAAGARTRARHVERQRLDWVQHCTSLDDHEFTRYYRVDKPTFQHILERLRPALTTDEEMARRGSSGPISPELQLSMTLRFLAGGSYLDIMLLHGVHRSTFFVIIWRVIDAINNTESFALCFPIDDADKLSDISKKFMSNRKSPSAMSGCVGALDGLCIEIIRPKNVLNSRSYFNRKGFFAIPLQAMVDSEYRFTYASMTVLGSTHDSLAFLVSQLGRRIAAGELPAPYWIAADAAYAASNSILTPYSGKNLTPQRDSFNYWLSRNRVAIEQAFGMLVMRWGVLWRPLAVDVRDVPRVVMSLLKLHNICISMRVAYVARHADDVREGDRARLVFQDDCHDSDELRRRRRDCEYSSLREALTAALAESGQLRPRLSAAGVSP